MLMRSSTSGPEHTFDNVPDVEPHELERLRRSIAMLAPGHSAGALTRDAAMALVEEVPSARSETARHRQAVAERHLRLWDRILPKWLLGALQRRNRGVGRKVSRMIFFAM
jgi:hypothetical protein